MAMPASSATKDSTYNISCACHAPLFANVQPSTTTANRAPPFPTATAPTNNLQSSTPPTVAAPYASPNFPDVCSAATKIHAKSAQQEATSSLTQLGLTAQSLSAKITAIYARTRQSAKDA